MISIAINGFGRIGRTFLRAMLASSDAQKKICVTAINVGPRPLKNIDLLFKYDSLMGTFDGEVIYTDNYLSINGNRIQILTEASAAACAWGSKKIAWVIECSGKYTKKERAQEHLAAGARGVIVSAPVDDADITIIPGVNDSVFDKSQHHIISLGSCTTNCFAPMIHVLDQTFGIQSGLMTTVHAYTNDQVLLDVEHDDPRRARAAALNIIPTKTGAHKIIGTLFPHLANKIHATALRVPTACVSLVDFSCVLTHAASHQEINNAFELAAKNSLRGILEYTQLPLVSSDFKNNEASCIIDAQLTQAQGNLVKVFGWYDNEFGYSCRIRDFLLHNIAGLV